MLDVEKITNYIEHKPNEVIECEVTVNYSNGRHTTCNGIELRAGKHVVELTGRDIEGMQSEIATKSDVQAYRVFQMNFTKQLNKIENDPHKTAKQLEIMNRYSPGQKFKEQFDYVFPPITHFKMLRNLGIRADSMEAKIERQESDKDVLKKLTQLLEVVLTDKKSK